MRRRPGSRGRADADLGHATEGDARHPADTLEHLAARLRDAEREAADAEVAAEQASAHESRLAEIDTAEFIGELTSEEAEAERSEITGSIERASGRPRSSEPGAARA